MKLSQGTPRVSGLSTEAKKRISPVTFKKSKVFAGCRSMRSENSFLRLECAAARATNSI
jgi:hypothetical protein